MTLRERLKHHLEHLMSSVEEGGAETSCRSERAHRPVSLAVNAYLMTFLGITGPPRHTPPDDR